MTIQSILYRNGAKVVTIRAKETVRSAADKMRERSIAALVVKSGDGAVRNVVGISARRNLQQANYSILCGAINRRIELSGRFVGKGLPAIDFAHDDLSPMPAERGALGRVRLAPGRGLRGQVSGCIGTRDGNSRSSTAAGPI